MGETRIAFAYLSITLISMVLFIIFVGVFLRSCFRTTKKARRRGVSARVGIARAPNLPHLAR